MNSSIMVSSGDPKLDKFINDYLRPLKSGRTPISKLVDEMYEKWLNKDLPGYGDLVTESQIKKMMFDYIKHTRATFAGKTGRGLYQRVSSWKTALLSSSFHCIVFSSRVM